MADYFIGLIRAMCESWVTIYQGLILVLLNQLGSLAMNCLPLIPTRELSILFILLLWLACICTVLGEAIVCVKLWGLIKAPLDWKGDF